MLKKEYAYKEFLRKEDDILRAPYTPELAFYSLIRSGDTEQVRRMCQESFIDKQGFGKLSENPLRNIRYHFIITIALIARYCIDGGLDVSTSYGLSDFYIQKADTCTTPEEISELHFTAVMDYTGRMKKLRKEKICSQQIAKCIDYIHDNLHTRITMETLANHVGLNPSYLSRLFKKETGCSVSEYIRNLKIDAAKYATLLRVLTVGNCIHPGILRPEPLYGDISEMYRSYTAKVSNSTFTGDYIAKQG